MTADIAAAAAAAIGAAVFVAAIAAQDAFVADALLLVVTSTIFVVLG